MAVLDRRRKQAKTVKDKIEANYAYDVVFELLDSAQNASIFNGIERMAKLHNCLQRIRLDE